MDALGDPLDPLGAEELAAATAAVRADERVGERLSFSVVETLEPVKGDPAPRRRAFVSFLDRGAGVTYEAVVALPEACVLELRAVPGAHIAFTASEVAAVDRLVRQDERFRAAMARRELALEDVWVGLFPAGNRDPAGWPGRRVVRTSAWLVGDRARDTCPIENVIAVVDLLAEEVLAVDDHGVVPVPPPAPPYAAAAQERVREDLRPLEISQPDGVSFELDGWELRWQKWRLRLGFTAREGLVLHRLAYRDGEAWRSVAHRLSLSEMVVPYGDPSPAHYDRAVFDAGEANMGARANSLELGCDCVGEIRYLDAVVADEDGAPRTIPNAICLHEEDHGVLWKHTDPHARLHEVRRSRRLVVSWFATLDNYDYGFYWSLYQDGTIELEVKLTGIVLVAAVEPGSTPAHGELVGENLNGLVHQHHFCVRLDLDVDGVANTVVESGAEALPPGEGNSYGTGFRTVREPLAGERAARREVDPLSARRWTVVNPAQRNALGGLVGYQLVPGENVRTLAQPDSRTLRRAGFLRHHLWVTPYAADERYAAGDYPNLSEGDGLETWTEADRPLQDTDVVLWYVFGHHHVPRPEDWPVMPVSSIGFALKPVGFFDLNPALDVAPPAHAHCHRSPA